MSYGALIAGGLALAGGVTQSVSQGKLNKKNRKWQEQMWERTNAYNHPTQQMNRLREAGLNPNLVYGSGSPYNTATNQNLPDAVNPGDYGLGNAAQAYFAQRNQTDIINNQTQVAMADATKKTQETLESKAREKMSSYDLGYKQKIESKNLSLIDNQVDLGLQNIKNAQADNVIKNIMAQQMPEAHKQTMMKMAREMQLIGSQMSTQELQREETRLRMQLQREGLENAPFYARWLMRQFDKVKGSLKPENLNKYYYNSWKLPASNKK